MSLFYVNLACRDLVKDADYRAAMQSDPGTALDRYKLTDEERRAILSGDVEALHAMRANNFLMYFLARYQIGGLDMPSYSSRMRALPIHEPHY